MVNEKKSESEGGRDAEGGRGPTPPTMARKLVYTR